MVVQPGLCGTWSETPKTGFLTTRLIYCCISFNSFYRKIFFTITSVTPLNNAASTTASVASNVPPSSGGPKLIEYMSRWDNSCIRAVASVDGVNPKYQSCTLRTENIIFISYYLSYTYSALLQMKSKYNEFRYDQ